MVADPLMGLINLQTKEVLHEYHINQSLCNEIQLYDMKQGTKLVKTKEAKYFILPNRLIMPYSYLSVVQHFQEGAYDKTISNFYTEDYYKLSGQTHLHKFMFNTVLLEKLLDDYWHQNQNYITAVLVKEELKQG